MNDGFYIGYETPVPPRARPLVYGAVALILSIAVGLSVVLVASQAPFANSSFAFGRADVFTGLVRFDPHPVLESGGSRMLLVAPGKHGADDIMRPFDSRVVALRGAQIARDGQRMIEVIPDSISETAATVPAFVLGGAMDLGERTVHGEIVDAKCYLGVMNPGEGPGHRDCAVACLRGGLPPMLAVRSDTGIVVLFALVSPEGAPLGRGLASWAGKPVTITGRLQWMQPGDRWVLRTSLSQIRWQ